MGLFGFGKKKEEKCACGCGEAKEASCGCGESAVQEPACACNGPVQTFEAEKSTAENALASVKVLGSGCKSCHALLVSTNEALAAMGASFEADYVTDMAAIAAYGVMSTPALVVNGRVVSMGKVLSAAEVEKLLHKLGY